MIINYAFVKLSSLQMSIDTNMKIVLGLNADWYLNP